MMSGSNMPIWWRRPQTRPAFLSRPIVLVTDIEGGPLQPGALHLSDERAALEFLEALGIPLIVNSTRTRAEIERLSQTLGLMTPFISEGGSALFLPHGSLPIVPGRAKPAVGGHVIEFGRRYHQVVDDLRLACRDAEVTISGFAELSIEDAAQELRVPMVEAQLAKLREYTELFRLADETDTRRSRLCRALRRRGLRTWRAGSHHLATATPDRVESLRVLRTLWRRTWGDPLIVGLGDSEDDVSWLRYADVAVVVQDPRTGVSARVLAKLPTAHVTRCAGRRGWSEAVFETIGRLVTPSAPVKATVGAVNRLALVNNHKPPS
jgi:mannosyl-3-phosphoglycerate phosphatase